ncbi:MAG TPA: hypothetical protein PLD88_13390, partial [Candidatus Berkiella sp.]|nr:hypothetical protein [Candidatus Berkiella sp.]
NTQDLPTKHLEKRIYLQQHFPEWFVEDAFNAQGFLMWAMTQPWPERNKWLRQLDIDEVVHVLNDYHIWANLHKASFHQNRENLHEELTQFLPFWFEDGQFDHIGF